MKYVRFLSFWITLLLCLLVAVPVCAEQRAATVVAMVNDRAYQNFVDAVEAWKQSSDATLTLLTDAIYDGAIEVSGNNLTLDLNGYSIKNKNNSAEIIHNNGSLTITGTGSFKDQKSNYGVYNRGTLVITGMPTFEVTGKTFQYYSGKIDLSGLSADTVDGWTIYFVKAVSDLSFISLPEYCQLQDKNGYTPEEFAARASATIKSLAPHEHTQISYTSNQNNRTHMKSYACCPNIEAIEETCSGGTATCQAPAVCDLCSTEYGETNTNNHTSTILTYTPNRNGTHTVVRACCNLPTLNENCSGGTATCQVLAVCNLCGAEYGETNTNNHTSTILTYTPNRNGTHTVVRACCNLPTLNENCSGGTATCQTLAVCGLCRTEYGQKDNSNHARETFHYSPNDSSTHTKKYDCCDATAVANESHSFGNNSACICTQPAGVRVTDADGNVTYYDDVSSALSNWYDNTTLTLLNSFSLATRIDVSGRGVVLDLNGFSLTVTEGTGDVISNQGSLTITGPGTINGHHGISNTTSGSLTLNDVIIVATGYGVQNFGSTTITGNTTIDAQLAAISFAQGELDLSGLSGETVNGWKVFAGKDLNNLDVIKLPGDYRLCVDGAPVTELAKNQKVTIQIPPAPLLFDIEVVALPTNGGTVTTDKTCAEADETVTLYFIPNDGYVFFNAVVKDVDNNVIPVTGSTFIMPSSNVTVTVTFSQCAHAGATLSYQVNAINNTKHDVTYSCCGVVITEAHSGGTATCQAKAACLYCNTEYGEEDTNNHTSTIITYTSNRDGTHTGIYSCCEVEAIIDDCSGGTATCKEQATCQYCNTKYGNLSTSNHVSNTYIYSIYDSSTHTKKYDCCDATAVANESHSFGNNSACICTQPAGVRVTDANGNATFYGDVSSALSSWHDNTTLTLLDSFSLATRIDVSGRGVILNLNNFSLTVAEDTGDVISNHGSLTITGPGTITGYHGISNTTNGSLTLNDVIIVATGYGLQNFGTTVITGNTTIDAKLAAINFAQGELDLSGLSGETVNGWEIFASKDLNNLDVIKLPGDYRLCVDGAPVTELTKGEMATIQIPTAPVLFDVTVMVTPTDGGTVSVDKTRAEADETVTLYFIPNDSYVFYNVVVKDVDNNILPVTDRTFIMPSSNVTVTVTFSQCDHAGATLSYQVNAIDSTKHDVTYACCGAVITESHSGGTATCQAKAACLHCNTEYGEEDANNHTSIIITYTSNHDGTHTGVYSCCKVEAVTDDCSGGTATCKEQATCQYCNTKYGNLSTINHASNTYTYSVNDSSTHTKKYDCCKTVASATEPHTFGDNGVCVCTQAALARVTDAGGNATFYGDLSSALSNWYDNTTLTLLDNFSLTSCIEVSGRGVVLNLNGFSLTVTEGTGDVISNQGSLTITGPGTIAGYHGINNATNKTLTLRDVSIVVQGYGVQNFGTTTITGNTMINSDLVALRYGGGSIDLSGMTDESIMGWTIHSIKAQPDLNGIILPSSTGHKLYDKNGKEQTSLAANQIVTILPVTEHVHTGRYTYTAAYNGTHVKLYACCDEVADAAENCSGGTADCQNRAVCQHCRARYGSVDLSNHVIANRFYYTADDATKTLHKNCVCQQSIASATLLIPADSTYDGLPKEATYTISGDFTSSRTLTYNTADGTAPTDAGTHTATLAVGTAAVSAEYTILPAPLTLIDASIADVAYRQDGQYAFNVAVTFGGLVGNDILVYGTDYTTEVTLNSVNTVGNNIPATVTVTLVNSNYTLSGNNTCKSTVNITVSNIERADIIIAGSNVYTGAAIEPDITVTLDGTTLTKGRDYSVAYANNVNAGTAAVTVTGMGNYAGTASSNFIIAKATPAAEHFIMALPDSLVYDGEPKNVTVSVRPALTGIGRFTVKYSPAEPKAAGTYKVLVDAAEGANFTSASNLEIGSFTISRSGTQITAASYLNGSPNTAFTYGQTITVKGAVTATGGASMRMAVPTANQVALFHGDVQISEPVSITDQGTFELTYDTRQKQLKPSAAPISLTIRYIGDQNGNMASTSAALTITLNAREVTVASVTATDRPYDGSRDVTITDVTLKGILAADMISVTTEHLTGTVASENAGTYNEVILPELTLKNHADASFYTLKQPDQPVATNVTIRKLHLTCESLPERIMLDAYCMDAEAVITQLPQHLICIGEDANPYTLDLIWKCERYNSAPHAENTFSWSIRIGPNFDVNITSGSILVANVSAKAVEHIGINAFTTYTGSTYDVKDMFALDPNAGEAVYSISGGNGEGKLNGTTLTITRAGTFIITLKTAAVGQYAAGTATATLTVSKGEPSCTVPSGLTATYGQSLADIPLDYGWTWKSPESMVGDAGSNDHVAVFTPENTDLWNTREITLTVSVSKADVGLAGMAATFLNGTATSVFTYGDVITVTAAPILPLASAAEHLPPSFNQMALFYGSTQISAPADITDGVGTMIYHTTDQVLPAGASTLSVHYVGNDNISNGSIDLDVTILPAELTIASVTAADRPYKPGDVSIPIIRVELAGKKVDSDDVFISSDTFLPSVESDQAGIYLQLTLPSSITLNGTDAQFYTIKGGVTLPALAKITKVDPLPTGPVEPSIDKDYTPGITLGDLELTLPETAFDVPGTVTWKVPSDTLVVPGQSYEWIFTPSDATNYKTVTGSLVIYPSATPTPTPPAVTPPHPVSTPEPPVVTPILPVNTPTPPLGTPDPILLPTVLQPVQDQLVALGAGDTVTLTITAMDAYSYQWYVDRQDGTGYRPINGATEHQLTIIVSEQDDGDTYLCRVSNGNGTINSPVFVLVVLPEVEPPLTGDASNLLLWAALLLLSTAGLLLMRKCVYNRK